MLKYILTYLRQQRLHQQKQFAKAPIMYSIGVNIRERKSGTERTKKRKKRELGFCSTARGHNTDFARATLPGLSRTGKTLTILQTDTWHDQMVNLYYEIGLHRFRIIDVPGCNNMLPTSQRELALPSTGNWLPSHLSST